MNNGTLPPRSGWEKWIQPYAQTREVHATRRLVIRSLRMEKPHDFNLISSQLEAHKVRHQRRSSQRKRLLGD